MFSSYSIFWHWLLPGVVGACLGSFLNVCIYRWPLGLSVWRPGSHCATCGTPLCWWQKLPVCSWFLLRGRALCCQTRIDSRYPLVELLMALLAVAIWRQYSAQPALALIYLLFIAALLVATFIDLDYMIIPDRLSCGGCLVGLVLSALYPPLQLSTTLWESVLRSAIGLAAGAGLLSAIALLGHWWLRRPAMGWGDVKLLAAIGSFLGWKAVLFTVAVAAMAGSLVGIAALVGRRWQAGMRLPFGPYLAGAAVFWLFGGARIMQGYLDLVIYR